MEREYTVIANTREDLPALEAEITASSGAGPIPSRSVDVANPRPGSKIQTHFMLTDEEAEALRADPRVRAVEIPPEQRDDIQIGLNVVQRGAFDRDSVLDATHINWGLRRCITVDTPYSNSGDRVTSIQDGNTGQSPDYEYAIDGSGVDVVIQDSGIDPEHPDWLYPKNYIFHTVTSLGDDFIDGSPQSTYFAMKSAYSPPTSGVLDISAYYSLEFKNAITGEVLAKADRKFGGSGLNSPSNLEFGFDGQGRLRVGETSGEISNSLTGGGTFTIGMPLVEFTRGSPTRMKEIDWFTESGVTGTQSLNHYRDLDGHGSHCASIAAGRLYGWAKGAHIYSQKLAGLETLSGGDGTGIPIANAFDCIRLWHNAKTNGRPTVVNMSWGYSSGRTGDPDSGVYRGTAWTYGVDYTSRTQLQAATGISQNYFSLGGSPGYSLPVRVASVDAEVEDMVADGIHVCIAAGNNLHKVDIPTGPDYDNEVTYGGTTNTYHRGSSPYTLDAFMVGNADSGFQNNVGATDNSDTREQTSVSTTRGPGVNIFAPGTDIMAATSRDYDTGSYTTTTYPQDANWTGGTFDIMKIGGTSMAAHQVAGVVAQHLQVRPDLTPAQMQQRIFDDALVDVMDNTGTDTDYNLIYNCLMGSPNRFLFSRYGKPPVTGNTNFITRINLT